MPKLIICVSGKPSVRGYRLREFHWSVEHNCYIYQNKEFELHEFNEAYAKASKNHSDMVPSVKVVGLDAAAPSPGATPEAPKEITLEQAEEVFLRLAPDRLKKSAHRKGEAVSVSV